MALTISSVCRGITPSATLGLNALVLDMKAQGLDVISLAAGEPDFATPPTVRQAGKAAIDAGQTKYTAVAGMPQLRQALSEHIHKSKGLRYQPQDIIVGSGAKQALMNALSAILDPGDQVLLPAPCWLSYPEMVRMAGGVPVPVSAGQGQGYVPTLEQLRAAVTSRTKAILVNSPNNPTGVVWPRKALVQVAELAAAHDLYIISDEIYESLVFEQAAHVSCASLGPDAKARTIMVSGFSKAYAMTGWRLGYAAGPRQVIDAMDAYQSHATGNCTSVGQWAALEALTGDQGFVEHMRAAFEKRAGLMASLLGQIPGFSFIKPQGAFYVLVDIRQLLGKSYRGTLLDSAGVFAQQMLEGALVSLVPGDGFYAPGCVRMSYATQEETLVEAARRMGAFVKELR